MKMNLFIKKPDFQKKTNKLLFSDISVKNQNFFVKLNYLPLILIMIKIKIFQ
jgi:hypothetical protein